MSEVLAAVIGAAAVLVIPLVAWSSQRMTREGRLLLRVNRLGSAFALMPESHEKKAFEAHLRRAIGELNEWVDPTSKAQRAVQRVIGGFLYVLGVAILFLVYELVGVQNTWLTSLLGVLIGCGIAAVSLMSGAVIQRVAAKREEARQQDERMERIRRGEVPGEGSASAPRTPNHV
jgi:hypothetical protein